MEEFMDIIGWTIFFSIFFYLFRDKFFGGNGYFTSIFSRSSFFKLGQFLKNALVGLKDFWRREDFVLKGSFSLSGGNGKNKTDQTVPKGYNPDHRVRYNGASTISVDPSFPGIQGRSNAEIIYAILESAWFCEDRQASLPDVTTFALINIKEPYKVFFFNKELSYENYQKVVLGVSRTIPVGNHFPSWFILHLEEMAAEGDYHPYIVNFTQTNFKIGSMFLVEIDPANFKKYVMSGEK